MSEHLRLNGVYWGLSALCLLGHQDALDRTEIIKYVKSCQTEEGIAMVDQVNNRWFWCSHWT